MGNRKKLILESLTLAIMAAGILMVWQPWVHALFRWGFLVTIVGIIAFMVASHLPDDRPATATAAKEAGA